MNQYPDKEQIEKKTEDFVRTLRTYILGTTSADRVTYELQCLTTDLQLELETEGHNTKNSFKNLHEEMRK